MRSIFSARCVLPVLCAQATACRRLGLASGAHRAIPVISTSALLPAGVQHLRLDVAKSLLSLALKELANRATQTRFQRMV
jgi:hypothetical protein